MAVMRHAVTLSWSFLLLLGALIAGLHPIFINLGKVNGKIPFSSASVALLVELTKFFMSGGFVLKTVLMGPQKLHLPPIKTYFLYGFPAIMYMISNNLITHIQMYMDPGTFQIMNNLKVATTAICYRLVINRHVSKKRWVAVALLFVGGVVNSLSGLNSSQSEHESYITMTGLYLVIIYCSISGVVGVYIELILKKYRKTSLHLQNMILYVFGVMLNGLMFSLNSTTATSLTGFLDGFSFWTWCIVLTQAINGIIISLVLKHATNLTRLFMVGTSTLLTSILSYLIFSYNMNIYFYLSFIIILIALYLYHERNNDITESFADTKKLVGSNV